MTIDVPNLTGDLTIEPLDFRFADPSRELCRINADGTVLPGDEQIAAVLELLIASRHEPASEDLARRLIEAAFTPLARCIAGDRG